MRCEIQECGKYHPCRMFIENTLAVEITMSAVKTQAANFKVNLDFPKWEHNRRVFCFE